MFKIRLAAALSMLFLMLAGTAFAAPSQQQYMQDMDKGLDLVMGKMQGQPRQPLIFSSNLFFAHGAAIPAIPEDVLIKYADALHDAGAGRVDINLAIDPWVKGQKDIVDKYDAVIARIRRHGMQLAINPEFNRGKDRSYDFAAWSADALKAYPEIAARYHPDIFVVIHEPTTMAARMGQKLSPRAWADFAQKAIAAVKQASPRTRCGVGLLPEEWMYTRPFLDLPGLDTLSVDIYSLKGLKALNGMIAAAKKAGKGVYVEETWRTPYVPARQPNLEAWSSVGIGNAAYEDLDAKWLATIAAYAGVWGMEAVTPFWSTTFFLYVKDGRDGALDAGYNGRVIEAIRKGERTKTFEAFRRMAQEAGGQGSGGR